MALLRDKQAVDNPLIKPHVLGETWHWGVPLDIRAQNLQFFFFKDVSRIRMHLQDPKKVD